MNLTIDSSVIIAALRRQEAKHKTCKTLLAQLKDGEHRAFESVIVPVEVAAAIRRRTGSEELARQVCENLLRLPSLFLIELTQQRMEAAAKIAEKTGLRGMDAIIVQAAEETEATLVTLDEEMANKGKEIITVKEIEMLLDELKVA
ncbi:MAG TPA: PIN domain-containing protein [Candidatus Acetothermia bacterium]|nr:PIN domain-containing protein [Candidatus Acetothermia bacterium]